MTAPDLEELHDLAVSLAENAGALAHDMREAVDLSGETKSSSTDIVTAADRAAEQLILRELEQARPDDAVLGEEGSNRAGTTGVRWLIDPIDGTTNYVYGIPAYSVSIAAEFAPGDGAAAETVVGVVHDPVSGDRYSAMLGRGSWLRTGLSRHPSETEAQRLRCSVKDDLATALVGTGFGYTPERRTGQAEVLLAVLPQVRDIRRFGSAALDLCHVAHGRVDAYFERGLNAWDLAAGALIAREAGATVGDLRGGPAGAEFTLAANRGLFERLGSVLRAVDADRRP